MPSSPPPPYCPACPVVPSSGWAVPAYLVFLAGHIDLLPSSRHPACLGPQTLKRPPSTQIYHSARIQVLTPCQLPGAEQ